MEISHLIESVPRTRTVLWHADDLDAELLHGCFADFSYDLHSHDTACLALITKGAIHIRMPGNSFIARAGDLYAIDAAEPHAGVPVDAAGWSQRTIYVDVGRLRSRVHEDRGSPLSLCGPVICDSRLNGLFLAVHRLSEGDAAPLARDERYLDFASHLFACHVRDAPREMSLGREPLAIRRAREFLDAHIGDHLHLADIANASGLTPFRLYRIFERAMGMTPHVYQRQSRIRLASRLIRLGQSLADVAAQAGFADQAHLTRCFFRGMGVTPGAYRNAVRGKVAFRPGAGPAII